MSGTYSSDYEPEIEYAMKAIDSLADGEDVMFSFDDKPDIAVDETGVWIACWVWVEFSDSRPAPHNKE
jgi:hypothetical protein